jgi:hypothetical protein
MFKLIRANILKAREAGLSDQQLAELMSGAPSISRGGGTFRDFAMDDAIEAIAFGHNRLDIGVLDGAIDGSTLADTDVTAPVKPPILILAADDALGAAFTTQDETRFAETHPAVEVIRILGSSHGIHDARGYREIFAQHLSDFLDMHAPRQASASEA